MKAGKVHGLDPSGALADNAQRIVAARLAELFAFAPAVLDERRVRELHDMRIAAKRLRYVLEVTAAPCFGPYARTAAKRAKELQDLLGEIHDCDVQLPRVRELAAALRDADAAELRRRAGDADDLDPALAGRLPHAANWRGLAALETYLQARRELLYARFLVFWRDLQREGLCPRLEFAIGERPEQPAPSVAPAAPDVEPLVIAGAAPRPLDLVPDAPPPAAPAIGVRPPAADRRGAR